MFNLLKLDLSSMVYKNPASTSYGFQKFRLYPSLLLNFTTKNRTFVPCTSDPRFQFQQWESTFNPTTELLEFVSLSPFQCSCISLSRAMQTFASKIHVKFHHFPAFCNQRTPRLSLHHPSCVFKNKLASDFRG